MDKLETENVTVLVALLPYIFRKLCPIKKNLSISLRLVEKKQHKNLLKWNDSVEQIVPIPGPDIKSKVRGT